MKATSSRWFELGWKAWVAFSLLMSVAAICPAAELSIPTQYSSILEAYGSLQVGTTNIISIEPRLYRESSPPLPDGSTPFRLDGSKHVILRSTGGRFLITATNSPTNDDFNGRASLTGLSASASGFTYAASIDQTDPLPAQANSDAAHFGPSLWWRWVAPTSGLFVVNTAGSDPDVEAIVDVFNGDTRPLTQIQEPPDLAWRILNEVAFNAVSQTPYSILVGGEDGSTGRVVLNLTYVLPPINDDFSNAFVLASESSVVEGTTIGATTNHDEPYHGDKAGHSVWFTWTAPTNTGLAPVTVTTHGSDFETVISVYRGSNITALTLVTNGDRRVSFTPANGAQYRFALDGFEGATDFRLRLGNYRLALDQPIVSVESRVEAGADTIGPVPRNFAVSFQPKNWGQTNSGPLRIRIVAQAGESPFAVQSANTSRQTDLVAPIEFSPLRSLERVSIPSLPVACPAPYALGSKSYIWGVFAILEERFEGTWIPIAREFLLYGNSLDSNNSILSIGPPPPTPLSLAALGQSSLKAKEILTPNFPTDLSTNRLYIVIQLPDASLLNVTNAITWSSASNSLLSPDGWLRIRSLTQSFSLIVTGSFKFPASASTPRVEVDRIPITLRPRLTNFTANGKNYLSIFGEPNAGYLLETTTNLSGNVAWISALPSNIVINAAGFTNTIVPTNHQRYFRVNRPIR